MPPRAWYCIEVVLHIIFILLRAIGSHAYVVLTHLVHALDHYCCLCLYLSYIGIMMYCWLNIACYSQHWYLGVANV